MSNNSLHIDPLLIAENEAKEDTDIQQKIKDSHEELMRRTGGQAVEEDLGGWLLAITVTICLFIGICLFQIILSVIATASGNYSVIINGVIYLICALLMGRILQNIFQRRNPTKSLARVCFLLTAFAAIELVQLMLGSIPSSVMLGISPSPDSSIHVMLGTLSQLFSAGWKVALSIVMYSYFTNSKRVKRTLIHRDILDSPKGR